MAFDTVEWGYMYEVLCKLGFGPKFIGWIWLLYADPLGQVRVNGVYSQIFKLQRGTCEGCPLSPLLFALVLEPVVAWIRRDPLI